MMDSPPANLYISSEWPDEKDVSPQEFQDPEKGMTMARDFLRIKQVYVANVLDRHKPAFQKKIQKVPLSQKHRDYMMAAIPGKDFIASEDGKLRAMSLGHRNEAGRVIPGPDLNA